MGYHVEITLGSFGGVDPTTWTFDRVDNGELEDTLTVLDSLEFGWSMPRTGLWPVQPDPMYAYVSLNVPDFSSAGRQVGDYLAIEVRTDADADVIARFYGDVTDLQAVTREDDTGVYISIVAIDYTVRLRELPRAIVLVDDETDTTDREIVDRLWADGDSGLGDPDGVTVTWILPEVVLTPESLPYGEVADVPTLLDQLLLQATDDGNDTRVILAPMVSPDHGTLMSDAGPVASFSGRRYTLDPIIADLDALPLVWELGSDQVRRDVLQWSTSKGRNIGYVITTGWGGEAANYAVTAVTDATSTTPATLPVTFLHELDAQNAADFYAHHAAQDAWQLDRLVIPITAYEENGGVIAIPVGLFPDWTLGEDDPDRSACYATGIRVIDVPTDRTPTGDDTIEGIIGGVRCLIGGGELTLEVAVRSTPVAGFVPPPPPDSATRTITVPAGKVASDLTRFPVRLNLSDITGDDFWDLVTSDGGTIRIVDSDDNPVPFDITWIDTGARGGEIFFLGLLYNGLDNVFTISATEDLVALDPTDANGRQGTWDDFEAVVIPSADSRNGLTTSTLLNRTGKPGVPTLVGSGVTLSANGLTYAGSGYVKVAGVAKFSTWTFGANVKCSTLATVNRTILSYAANGATDANRATMGVHSSSPGRPVGMWNSTDTWANGTTFGTLVGTVGPIFRFHGSQANTVNRKQYRDGVIEFTDLVVAIRPASTGDCLFIGVEDTSAGEVWAGDLDLIYLIDVQLSADWIAAEQASWRGTTFYTIT